MADPEASRWWSELDAHPDLSRGYDTLVSSLVVAGAKGPLTSIMVTSAQPGEGKTTVAMNLALTMARAERKVLVVDADLRKSRVHRIVGLDKAPGLAELLAGAAALQDVTRVVKAGSGSAEGAAAVSVITSGQVSSASFQALGARVLKDLIASAARQYDLVVLDAPPVLAVNDPQLLAPAVDGVILVLDTGRVSEREALRVKTQLEENGGRIVGVVMNRFEEEAHGPGVHPYSSYYDR